MFSKPPTPNVERRTKEITYDFTYESLFQFIKKNTILKNKINEIESNSEKLSQLKQAIEQPDFDAQIFSDSDCDIYLLRLFKDNNITASTFLCVYNYLMACMQYGDQPVKANDEKNCKVKLKTKPKMIPLFNGEDINELFKGHIYFLAMSLTHIAGKHISESDIISHLKKLPVVEQYIICLDFDNINNEAELNATLASDTHFTTEVGRKKYYFNLTATESIKKLINEVPIRVLPGFGVVGSETFADLRYHDLAFYPLYSKYVNNNLITVHGGQYRGPFSIAQHDNYHALVASFFNSDDRKFACGTLPAFLGNNLFLSVDDLKPLLYGDGSFSDLDPGSYTELMYFLDIEPGEKRIIEYISAVSTVFIVRKLGDLRQLAEKSEDYQLEIDKHSHGFKTALALIKSLTDLSLLQDFPRKEMLNEVMKEIAIKIEEIPFIRDEDKKDILQYYRDQSHEQEVRVGCGNG